MSGSNMDVNSDDDKTEVAGYNENRMVIKVSSAGHSSKEN